MKNFTQPKGAILLFLLTLLISLFLAPALRAQVLLEENFDATTMGDLPTGWADNGNAFSNVTNSQACAGNAYRLNLYNGNISGFLDSPVIPRGNTPGKVNVSFDLRVADYNNSAQLTGTGRVFVQLRVNGMFNQDFIAIDPIALTNCERQSVTFPASTIPLGADLQIRFLGTWGSGDWAYVVDNVRVRALPDDCVDAV
ncbi:MAG: hypothetical protein AAFN92_21290, partial [Bacteroidota bacterium]